MLTTRKFIGVMVQLAWLALAAAAGAAIPITVTDVKGRSIEIEVVSLSGDSVTFSRTGSAREFTLPINSFEENSRELIRKQAALLPPPVPKISADVSIGKKRKKYSYYMEKQTVSCSVKLSNLDTTRAAPPLQGQIVFLGQNCKYTNIFIVLSTQTFETSIERGGSVTRELKSFSTAYDNYNKGTGNIGGFEYYGYVLVLKDKDGRIVFDQPTAGKLAQTLKDKKRLIEEIMGYTKGQQLTEDLKPSESKVSTYRPPN